MGIALLEAHRRLELPATQQGGTFVLLFGQSAFFEGFLEGHIICSVRWVTYHILCDLLCLAPAYLGVVYGSWSAREFF